MEEIEVTACFDTNGDIIPIYFTWKNQRYKVISIGRHWQTEAEYHILVMNHKNQTFQLIFKPNPPKWYLLNSSDSSIFPFV